MGCQQLSEAERHAIACWRCQGQSLPTIAVTFERSLSTTSREVRRNATIHDGHCRLEKAQQYAVARCRRSRRNLHFGPRDWAPITRAIRRKWSPAQIVGRARLQRRPTMSAETIYRAADSSASGILANDLRSLSDDSSLAIGKATRSSAPTSGIAS
ncbi:MAG: IS30 family transposase [Proteobacteria bacterium]|nr:IS30 family transposase [Pseudomonadota bacterium]